jgi:hypothetical protein
MEDLKFDESSGNKDAKEPTTLEETKETEDFFS